ncbi:MAG: translation initiation factor IF-2 [Odoribacteraceae bacterium]|nr:translation initiation factor IF-2 [Odoribacteraceae bacterium]
MAERLSKVAREFNVGLSTIVEYLQEKGIKIPSDPNTKLTEEQFLLVEKAFSKDSETRKGLPSLKSSRAKKETVSIDSLNKPKGSSFISIKDEVNLNIKVIGHIDPNRPWKTQAGEKEKKKVVEPENKQPEQVKKEEAPATSVANTTPTVPVENAPVAEAPVAEKPAAEKQVEVEQPTIVAEKPAGEQPPAEKQPVAGKPVEDTPVAETTAVDNPPVPAAPPASENTITAADTATKIGITIVGNMDLSALNQRTRPPKKTRQEREREKREMMKRRAIETLAKPPVKPPVKPDDAARKPATPAEGEKPAASDASKPKRKRILKKDERINIDAPGKTTRVEESKNKLRKLKKKKATKTEITEEDVQKQIKDTYARIETRGKTKSSKYRKDKREAVHQRIQAEIEQAEIEKSILKVTEFVTVSELASMMGIPPTQIISACMSLGLFVGINQRLDAETIHVVAEEFGFVIEFVSVDIQEAIEEEDVDNPADVKPRPPIVTVMGHVDHGKTSLLDHIRKANVIAGEAGGITQHIGAYSVTLNDGRAVTFLDTPGHEAFTAMRARGASITDIAIIIVAADDHVMPQTVEAINHASAAGVPIVFAINKIDRPGANPEKIKEELSAMNYLVEDWGGKYQSQEISAKQGLNIEELLEKVLLEAEILELKANPNRKATGSTIESSLEKGRGHVATVLVQNGTLRVGDIVLAGQYFGHVKAMFNERGQRLEEAGPATPVLILGLNGAPQAGDKFNVMNSEKEARSLANKREQLQREQGLRTQRHITLDEIGRRIAVGNFQELNIIVKADVDGSIEALSDSLIKLSTPEIQVNVIHKAVGQISEGDVMLAAASNAIIVGFQVRPSLSARKLAEKEQIDIRLYSIIYTAIEEIKAAMEGMLSPEMKEEVTATVEVMETFKISKVGTIAGCIVRDGKITRSTKARVIRDGIVIHTGELGSLKRFKDDVKEVAKGFECGLNLHNFNDMQVGDFIESFEEVAIKKTL